MDCKLQRWFLSFSLLLAMTSAAVSPTFAQQLTTSGNSHSTQFKDHCNGATDNFQPAQHGWYWTWENDAAGVVKSDSYYTQGAQVGYTLRKHDDPGFLQRLASPLCKALGFTANGDVGDKVLSAGSIFFGQQLFTPKDTTIATPIPDDRPYAGWAYVGSRLELLQPLAYSAQGHRRWRTHSFELQVGAVGPLAQGEATQRAFHDLDESAQSNGWDNQISNRFGWQAFYHYSTRLYSFAMGKCCSGLSGDVLLQGTGALGNLQTYGGGTAVLRIGRNMGPMAQRTIAPSALTASLRSVDANGETLPLSSNLDTTECRFLFRAKECYVFVGASARGVAKNIFLDGVASGAGADISPEPLVYELTWGFRARYSWARFDYISTTRSREFEPAPANPLERKGRHDFGSVTMSCYGEFGGYSGKWQFLCPGFVAAVTGFLVLR